MGAIEYYAVTLGVFAALNGILALGMNLQFGYTGILNLAFMALVAIGAYMTGIATLPPSGSSAAVTYIGGFQLPFPVNVLVGVASTGVIAGVLGLIVFRKLRHDYLALGVFSFGLGLWNLVENDPGLFNGSSGIFNIEGPGQATLDPTTYQLVFLAISLVALALVWAFVWRIDRAPLARAMKAVRDDEVAFAAIGKSPLRVKIIAFGVGACMAGLAGALFALYVGAWSTSSWQPLENLLVFAAVVVGGRGRPVGSVVGSILLMTVISQGSQFLPVLFDRPDLVANLQELLVMVVLLAFLWWRPQGLFPERVERFADTPSSVAAHDIARPSVVVATSNPQATNGLGSAASPLLSLENVTVAFGGLKAVDGVTLSVGAGSLVGLIGPNGAGKSTLLAAAAGSIKPKSGSIRFLGEDVTGQPASRVASLGLVRTFQAARVFGRLSVTSNLMVAAREQPGESLVGAILGSGSDLQRERLADARRLIDLFGMPHVADHAAGQLSGGQQRLTELARVLMAQPKMILLDEPFAGVSPPNRRALADILRDLVETNGISILIVEHNLGVLESMCDDVVVMDRGRMLARGSLRSLREDVAVGRAYVGI